MDRSAQAAPTLSWRKKFVFSLIATLLLLVAGEVAARVVSYLAYGLNPYYLLYGFRSWTDDTGAGHSDKQDGYFKFPPNRIMKYGTPEPCRINSQGFRGRDFDTRKPAGTFRVICLGGSSTFGYLNRDEGTYPRQLERMFEDQPASSKVEVINAGIPHFRTSHIRAAIEQEILDYDPDLITIYTAYNDAARLADENTSQAASRWLDEHSALYAAVRKGLSALGANLPSWWDKHLPRSDRASVERQVRRHVEELRANLVPVLDTARAQGIHVIFIKQPMTLWFLRKKQGKLQKTDPRTTYEAEYREVAAALERDGEVPGSEALLYTQHALVDEIVELAQEYDLSVVDNIRLQEERPNRLGSAVHLTEEANGKLAAELYPVVREIVDRTQ